MNRILLEDAERICERVDLSPLDGATILITGATGLIGTHLLASLCVSGVQARIWGIFRTELPPHIREIAHWANFKLMRADLARTSSYELPWADVTIHAAGYASPARFLDNPLATLCINTVVTDMLLRRTTMDGGFLFLSSSEIYSGWPDSPSEISIGTTTPSHVRAPYIEGKRCGEAICHAFRGQGWDVKIARASLVYGPGTRPHDQRALNHFIESALTQGHIQLRDAGLARRSYCYVTDAVTTLWKILLEGQGVTYNVGGCHVVTIAELAEKIAFLTGARVTHGPILNGLMGAPASVRLNLTRTETELGPINDMTLAEGLARTVEWQRELYE